MSTIKISPELAAALNGSAEFCARIQQMIDAALAEERRSHSISRLAAWRPFRGSARRTDRRTA